MMVYQTPDTYTLPPGMVQSLQLTAAALSAQGRRENNEDTILHHVSQTLKGEPLGLFIVCDGMGGYDAGDVASRMAVHTVCMELAPVLAAASDTKPAVLNELIQKAITAANRKIWQYAQNRDEVGFRMGTTLTLAIIVGQRLHISHVGHSRAYLWRKGQLKQITHDHSLVTDLAQHIHLTREQVAKHPYRNVLTRALGRRETIEVDQFVERLFPGDRLMLCTDGLWKAFARPQELIQQLGRPLTPKDQCQQLVAAADQLDSSDNISVVIVHCDDPFVQVQTPFRSAFQGVLTLSPQSAARIEPLRQDAPHA